MISAGISYKHCAFPTSGWNAISSGRSLYYILRIMSSEKSSPNTGIPGKIEELLMGLFFMVGSVFRTAFAFSFRTSKLPLARKISQSDNHSHTASERPEFSPPITFFLTLVAGLLLVGAYVRPILRAYETLKKNPITKPDPHRFGEVSMEEQFNSLTALLPGREIVEGVAVAASKMSLSELAVSMLPYIGLLALFACCLFLVLRVLRRPLPFTQSLAVSAYFAGSMFFWSSICVCLFLPLQVDWMARLLAWIQTLPTDPHADAARYEDALNAARNSLPNWKWYSAYVAIGLAACTPIVAIWGFMRLLWLRTASFATAGLATLLSIGLFYLSLKVVQPVVSPILDSMRAGEQKDWFPVPPKK